MILLACCFLDCFTRYSSNGFGTAGSRWPCDINVPPIETKDGIIQVPPFAFYCQDSLETLESFREGVAFTVRQGLARSRFRDEFLKALKEDTFDMVFRDGTPVRHLREMAYRTVYIKLRPNTSSKSFLSKLLGVFSKSR